MNQPPIEEQVKKAIKSVEGLSYPAAVNTLQIAIMELCCKSSTNTEGELDARNAEGILMQSAVNGANMIRKINAQIEAAKPKIEIAKTLPPILDMTRR